MANFAGPKSRKVGRPKIAHDPYDLDAEFGPRGAGKKPIAGPKRRNTTALETTVKSLNEHSDYFAPKYTGPGLSYRRNPFVDVNARKTTTPTPKKQKIVEVKKTPKKRKTPAQRRQSAPDTRVAKKKTPSATDRRDPSARPIKKPVRYDEFVSPSSEAGTPISKRAKNNNESDSGLVFPHDSDVQQSDVGDCESYKFQTPRKPSVKASTPLKDVVDLGEQIRQWLGKGTPQPPKPAYVSSIDSLSIRGGGVSDSEDEVPLRVVNGITPKTPIGKNDEAFIPVPSNTLEAVGSQELVPVTAMASQMVAACEAELNNFWQSFSDRDDEIFSNFVSQTRATVDEITENNRKIKTSEMFIVQLRTEMMAQMETIEMINVKNIALMSSLEKTIVDNVNDQMSHTVFDSLLKKFVDEAYAHYKVEWTRRKSVLAERTTKLIENALTN